MEVWEILFIQELFSEQMHMNKLRSLPFFSVYLRLSSVELRVPVVSLPVIVAGKSSGTRPLF